jgi:phosphoglycolate phosphatase
MRDCHGLVVFDLDGTLFCADDATVPAVQQTFRQYGLTPPDTQLILDYIGPAEDEVRAWLRSLCPPHMAKTVVEAVFRRERSLLAQTGYLYPGVRPVLDALRASVCQMAICSYAAPDYAAEVMFGHDLARYFDQVRCRASLADDKERMLRELLELLPARPAVVIGDRAVDIEAAHAHGLPAIGVTYGYGTEQELAEAGADAITSTATELPDLVHMLLQNGK